MQEQEHHVRMVSLLRTVGAATQATTMSPISIH